MLRHLSRVLACLAAGTALLGAAAAPAAADTGDPLSYYGGPVAHSMTGVLVDWGASVNRVFAGPGGDPGLLGFLSAASGNAGTTGSVLAQYMDTSGQNAAPSVSYGGQYAISPASSAGTLQDSQVASQLVSAIGSGALPRPAADGMSTVYLVLFPAGVSVCGAEGCTGQAICSFHSSTYLPDGTHVLYVVLPDDSSGPESQGCGVESTPLRNQTSYLTHEWAETISDPLVTEVRSMGPPLAWYDANCPAASSMCGEAADKCNQEDTVQGGWTVQLLWSNLDRACVGAEGRYAAPSVGFTPPAAAAPGVPALFSAAASDPAGNAAAVSYAGRSLSIAPGIRSVTWSWGDGSPSSSGAQATHSFPAPGVYDVSVAARDDLGFVAAASHPVAVWGPLGAPSALTGQATVPHSSAGTRTARLAGSVVPAGVAVGYRFDYGTGALGSSTALTSVGSRTGSQPASASLTGLRPATTYSFRLDVVVGGLVLPGAVHSFRTAAPSARAARSRTHHARLRRSGGRRGAARVHRALRHGGPARTAVAVPVAASVLGGQTLAGELRHGLLVRVSCSAGCRASVMATLRVGVAAVPRALALATLQVAPSGSAVVALPFTPSARAWLSQLPNARFAVAAYAR